MSALLDWITAAARMPAPETSRDPEPCSEPAEVEDEPATVRSPVSSVPPAPPSSVPHVRVNLCPNCGREEHRGVCYVANNRPARAARPAVAMVTIVGNTYPVREALKAMGARWIAVEKSWRVPADRAEEARTLVAAAGNVRGGPRRLYSGECSECGDRCNPRFKTCYPCSGRA